MREAVNLNERLRGEGGREGGYEKRTCWCEKLGVGRLQTRFSCMFKELQTRAGEIEDYVYEQLDVT